MATAKNAEPDDGFIERHDPMPGHDLEVFLNQDLNEMASEYARIFARATEDPGTAGDEGEENWAQLLRSWLPDSYTVVTKGRILGADGRASPQVDLIVLKPSYPPRLIHKKMYLVSGVAAVFECKTTLKRSHLSTAAKTAAALRKLSSPREGTPHRELTGSPMYGVLAHSHAWKSPASTPLRHVKGALEQDAAAAAQPRDLLDLVCVADLGAWLLVKVPLMGRTTMGDRWTDYKRNFGLDEEGGPATTYFGRTTDHPQIQRNPIGVAVAIIFQVLAWENPSLRPMAEYFRLAGLWGGGTGNSRYWRLREVYSEAVADRLLAGDSSFSLEWNEWQQQIP